MTKILIADDNRLTIDLLQTLFELEGYDVICLNNSRSVVSTAEEQKPAIILLDFYLGGTESTRLIREIRQIPAIASTPIIVFSGAEKGAEVLAAGADRFLFKPFSPSELLEMIKTLTDS
jgi:two-component system phosphate regulon response regulator PhoB